MPDPGSLRIVKRLLALYPELSASRLKRAVTDGQVLLDGTVVDDPGTVVREDSRPVWDLNRPVRRRTETGLSVLFEDADAIAAGKPAGLLTHPTEAKERDTLVARVSTYVARRYRAGRPYVAVVHRLDKDTSGILVFARSRRGLVTLQAQLRGHTMDRRYTAIVEGGMAGDSGTFDWDIVEEPGNVRRRVARPGENGQRAVTTWRVLERFGTGGRLATLVEARLKTGRTHQIRIHFAKAGHPVVGDPVYRGHPDSNAPPFPIAFPRQALHAGHLGFRAPSGQLVSLDAPVPADLAGLLVELRKRGAPRAVAASARETHAAD